VEHDHQEAYELSCGHVVIYSAIPAAGDLVLCRACGYAEVCVMRRADGRPVPLSVKERNRRYKASLKERP